MAIPGDIHYSNKPKKPTPKISFLTHHNLEAVNPVVEVIHRAKIDTEHKGGD